MCTASASSTPEITAEPRIRRRGKKTVSAMFRLEDGAGRSRKRIADWIARIGLFVKMQDSGAEAAAGASYAYKASLIGSAHRFELTEEGLSWHIGGRSALWRYDEISAIRLSFRPV